MMQISRAHIVMHAHEFADVITGKQSVIWPRSWGGPSGEGNYEAAFIKYVSGRYNDLVDLKQPFPWAQIAFQCFIGWLRDKYMRTDNG